MEKLNKTIKPFCSLLIYLVSSALLSSCVINEKSRLNTLDKEKKVISSNLISESEYQKTLSPTFKERESFKSL